MMAPVASRTGTCQSLVAISVLLTTDRNCCHSNVPPGRSPNPAGGGGTSLVLDQNRLLRFAERAFYPARGPVGGKKVAGSKAGRERDEAPTPIGPVDRLPAAGRGRLRRRRRRRGRWRRQRHHLLVG